MERKIGEIFEYYGEWYQCVGRQSGEKCIGCSFKFSSICIYFHCLESERKDHTKVIFKKLEKVGEPYVGNNGTFQSYKLAMPIYGDIPDQIIGFTTTEVVIKQTKEDMEEKKLDPRMAKVIDEATQKMSEEIGRQIEANINRMKPFNLEAAKAGKPVCTRDARKARIICFDKSDERPIVALISDNGSEFVYEYLINGKCYESRDDSNDLMMLPEKKEGWVNIYALNPCYSSKEEAEANIDRDYEHKYVRTVKIEWEE